jgi:tripartite-type tricarboxylate transporter receptor subunit TctC
MFTRRGVAGVLLTSALTHSRMLRAANAQPAQSWPSRGVRIICPVAPGGAIDAVTRVAAARLSEIWRQQVVVANRRQQQYRGGSGRPRRA